MHLFRGLITPWKYIVYFDFDTPLKKKLLFKIIEKCESVFCNVRGIVCDMGNKTLLSELGVNSKSSNYYFRNPYQESRSVYIFPDMCHCVKNMRNHTLDYGMVIKFGENEKISLTKEHFAQLISCDGTDFKLNHKLLYGHLEVTGVQRQRVRPAMELFSNSVSDSLNFVFGDQAKGQLKVVKIIDSWIDKMNSRLKYDFQKQNRCGLGNISSQ